MLEPKEITRRANEQRDEFVEPGSVAHTPVIKIANRLGFTVTEFSPTPETQSVSGAVDHGKKTIFVNESEHPGRKRFTIAHEIGHIMLHAQDGDHVDYRGEMEYGAADQPKEREANIFAGALLMPKGAFEAIWQAYSGNASLVASHFQVTPSAVKVRAKELNLG